MSSTATRENARRKPTWKGALAGWAGGIGVCLLFSILDGETPGPGVAGVTIGLSLGSMVWAIPKASSLMLVSWTMATILLLVFSVLGHEGALKDFLLMTIGVGVFALCRGVWLFERSQRT